MLAQSPAPKYAPHPGELSGETWPMSMADMTEELLRTRNRNRHNSLIHSSAYDNRAEAAAGAAALVGATHTGPSPYAAPAAPAAPSPLSGSAQPLERAPPAPAMASPPLAVSAQLQQNGSVAGPQRRSQLPPLRLPVSPFLADDYVLPSVVLTPPPDDLDAPVTLYPRASPDGDYPQRGMSTPILNGAAVPSPPRSASLPAISNEAVQQRGPQPPASAQAGPASVMGFQKPTPPFGRKHRSSVAAVVMPKKAEQVINEMERKSGARFDAEWNELVEELPSPSQSQANDARNAPVNNQPKTGAPLPFPSRPAPPPPSQPFPPTQQSRSPRQQQRSVSAPGEPLRPETPKTPKSKKGKLPKEPSTPTEASSKTPKAQRRRSLSLSALFSRKKKPNFDDLPPMPMPPTPKTPQRTEAPQLPDMPKSTTSEKRKTLLKRASFKDLFGGSNSAERKALRKTQSKPELHTGNRLVTEDAPPVPALPSTAPGFTAPRENKQVVPDALAALTANSNTAPSEPAVEMVPDLFAAFNSSQTSLQQRGVSAQLKGISAPSNPRRAESPFANFEHSTEFAASQQRLRQANGSQVSLTAPATEAKRAPSPLAHSPQKPAEKEEDPKAHRRSRSLSKRLSLSALFSKKKKDTDPVPDMPTLPSSYQRAVPAQQPPARQQASSQPGSIPKSASAQELPAVRAFSPMMNGTGEKARPVSAKPPPRTPTTARVPVPRMENGAEAVSPEKQVPAPPSEQEGPSSTVKKYPDPNISKQAPMPPAIAAAAAKLRGESAPIISAPAHVDGPKTDDSATLQARREQSTIPSSSAEYLRQQQDAIASHQHAQQALVQQFRSASEPISAGPPRSASEQSFQRAANPFAEQAPSAEVIQQAAALVRKPAPMQVVQRAEAEYRKDKEHAEKIEKLDEKPLPASWTTFDSEPKPHTTQPLKITKKSSLSAGSRDKETAPLRINKEQPISPPLPAAMAGAAVAGAAVAVVVTPTDASKPGSPGKPSSPQYKENPSFSFPPKPKAGAPTLFQPAPKIRRVSVPPLQPESLNSPHSAIPVPIQEAGGPFSDTPAQVQSTLAPSPALVNATLDAEPTAAPIINIITATPAHSPAPSHAGGESCDSTAHRDVVSPVPSETSRAVVTTAVRTSIVQTTPPVLTSAANMAMFNDNDERPQPGSPSDSEFTLPTLESHSPFASEEATPTDESFNQSTTPTKSSGMPAVLVAGASALAAAATAAVSAVSGKSESKEAEVPPVKEAQKTEELMDPVEPKTPDSVVETASVDHGLAYLDSSSVDTHESVQTPGVQPNAGFLSLRPVTDEDISAANETTSEEEVDTPVAKVKGTPVAETEDDDSATPTAIVRKVPVSEGPEAGAPVHEAPVIEQNERPAQSTHASKEEHPRSESVPPMHSPTLMPGGLSMSSLPTRLSVSPVAEGVAARPAQRSSIFAMAASAASAVSSAVSSAFADASETLDEIDEKIEKTVKAAPAIANIVPTATPGKAAAVNATVVQTGRESRQGSVFSARRRGSSSDDGASIYTTPMTDMDGDYFDSPSASTTSFETASSNATLSPETHTSMLPSYSNSARPPSIALFDDLPQPPFARPAAERRGSMPAALVASAARKRGVSSPIMGSSELPSVTMPSALGIGSRSGSRQGQRSATMPISTSDIANFTPPTLPAASADGHSEESSTFHLDTETITDSPTENFAALPDSPTSPRSPRSRMRDASSMYVVPFSPEMEELQHNEARTQTSSNYVPSSGVREHVRRASGGIRNALAAAGFGRSDEVRTVVSGQAQPIVPEMRNSVAVDYSSPGGSKRASAAPVGLGMWTADEIEELGPFRRIAEADTSMEESWSSGSDDHESPRTPRTPELDALVTPSVLPGPGTPSPADKGPKRTGAPFRALHVDMAAEA
ncbi:hypothetical protein CC85DRAFT_311784 [Cutaneotrichosporon oleaginosum]|uniref:Uncharacterized protein n=1 Tax=Cutaneotrichosporon oleaginosum TaxID=879819 RepID=A0A0J0XQC0_9TREE|nr:uncharacterized protein CC85DRAFT_311784 [Cutaneotrichosporon oleaginosum]KLT43315.1 hypothetical protein CC85DRAFT_311784 [Cutaneotrichosporon oleaginosum]TXT14423.1 hypothetical protein COLE_00616 [Cutaneotrichosporon oleaginosum]